MIAYGSSNSEILTDVGHVDAFLHQMLVAFLKTRFSILGHMILVPKESVFFTRICGNKFVLRDSAPLASKIPTPKGRAYMRAQPLDRNWPRYPHLLT